MRPALRISKIIFRGPTIVPIEVELKPGLNVIEGATETGKSFLLEVIDFMLGAGGVLQDLPERIPYDTVLMQINVSDGHDFTIQRSSQGGRFLWQSGKHESLQSESAENLADSHSGDRDDNLSHRLLRLIGLSGHIVRTKANEVRSLSFRDLAYLAIVDEIRIVEKISPVLSKNYADNPRQKAVLKFVLTGIDDSSIVAVKDALDKVEQIERRRAVIAALMESKRAEMPSPQLLAQTRDRLAKIELQLGDISADVSEDEATLSQAMRRRRLLDRLTEDERHRVRGIQSLLARFDLLEKHYVADVSRLNGIGESTSLFETIHPGPCPLCGAPPEAQTHNAECDVDPQTILKAAQAEIDRVEQLRLGLADTRARLDAERKALEKRIETNSSALEREEQRGRQLSLTLRERRKGVGQLTNEASNLRQALRIADFVQELEAEYNKLGENLRVAESDVPTKERPTLPTGATSKLVESIEGTLTSWNVPDVGRLQWNEPKVDIVIGPRQRADRGKGLRALTCSAFLLTLLRDARIANRPHAGFVAIDSPLLSYWAPEGEEDDLRGTDVEDRFYRWIIDQTCDWQVIIVENKPSPPWVKTEANVIHFTKNMHMGRFGLFPPIVS